MSGEVTSQPAPLPSAIPVKPWGGASTSGAYLSNRAVWQTYRTSPDRKAFYMAHRRELEACSKARKELKEIFPDGRAPALNELKAERQRLTLERNKRYEAWTNERYRHRELETAKRNVNATLGGDGPKPKEAERSAAQGKDDGIE